MKIEDAIDDFLIALRADGLQPATAKWYSSLLKSFLAVHPDCELEHITPPQIRSYIIALRERKHRYIGAPQKPVQPGGLAHESVRGHVNALHSFWAWCSREYKIANPMGNIKRPKRSQPEPRAISPEDFVTLFDAATSIRDRALLAFFVDSGARLGGVVGLTLERLDISKGRAIVIEKGERRRLVVFTPYVSRLLSMWISERSTSSEHVFTSLTTGAPLTDSGVSQIIKRLKKRAGVTGRCNPHAFRHRFALAYLEAGGDPVSLAKLLGDNLQTVFDYYTVWTDDSLARLHLKYSPLKTVIDGLK